jgi:hypothetical protein
MTVLKSGSASSRRCELGRHSSREASIRRFSIYRIGGDPPIEKHRHDSRGRHCDQLSLRDNCAGGSWSRIQGNLPRRCNATFDLLCADGTVVHRTSFRRQALQRLWSASRRSLRPTMRSLGFREAHSSQLPVQLEPMTTLHRQQSDQHNRLDSAQSGRTLFADQRDSRQLCIFLCCRAHEKNDTSALNEYYFLRLLQFGHSCAVLEMDGDLAPK